MEFYRGRRLRQSQVMRDFCRETAPLLREELIMPYFVAETADAGYRKEIASMPGQFQLSLDELEKKVSRDVEKGLMTAMLYGIPAGKDEQGTSAWKQDGIVQQAVRRLKKAFPGLIIVTDVCLCEYMAHGHCGILTGDGRVLNDATLPLLSKTAVSLAEAGADILAPSDMMDGRIAAIRQALDGAGFVNLPLMSYAAKYASSFYGPFRDAAESAPACGDRKTYQMDPGNAREALREMRADIAEGADMLIVKPAASYGDIIALAKRETLVPICAYQVSGEYSMIMAAAEKGWINGEAVMLESLMGLKRAGADILITYFAGKLLREGLAR
ncbi:MAG: porphobilinogen synthase [Desulfovibrio sp.]|nr:porphobilinogen synthase [Desulfovibrio sp.]